MTVKHRCPTGREDWAGKYAAYGHCGPRSRIPLVPFRAAPTTRHRAGSPILGSPAAGTGRTARPQRGGQPTHRSPGRALDGVVALPWRQPRSAVYCADRTIAADCGNQQNRKTDACRRRKRIPTAGQHGKVHIHAQIALGSPRPPICNRECATGRWGMVDVTKHGRRDPMTA